MEKKGRERWEKLLQERSTVGVGVGDLQRRARESHCGMSPPRRPTDLRSLKSSEPHGSLLNGSSH